MLNAREKRRTNISEYILYMWQVEDMLRAFGFDIEMLNEQLIAPLNESDQVKEETKKWYTGLSEQMHIEGITESGHLSDVRKVMNQLFQLHDGLCIAGKDTEYFISFEKAVPHLEMLRQKSGDGPLHLIQLGLTAMYGLWMLRLKKQEISKETLESLNLISVLLAMLSQRFNEYEAGNIVVPDPRLN